MRDRRLDPRRAFDDNPMELAVALIFLVTGPRFIELAFTWASRQEEGTITALPLPLVLTWGTLITLAGVLVTTGLSLRTEAGSNFKQALERGGWILGMTGWGIFAIASAVANPTAWWSYTWILCLTIGMVGRFRLVGRVLNALRRVVSP